MNPYRQLPFTALMILAKEYRERMSLHRRLADDNAHEPRSSHYQENNQNARYYAEQLDLVEAVINGNG